MEINTKLPNLIFKKVFGLSSLAFFALIYFGKQLSQKKKGIKTDQLGSGKTGKLLIIENVLKFSSWLMLPCEILSIYFDYSTSNVGIFGILLAIIGDIIFLIAVITMKDSWRAGIPKKEKVKLIKEGIYNYSRNPAFLGFYLLYIGLLIAFYNHIHLIMTIITIASFHSQVLQEEEYLSTVFGKEYSEYKNNVNRYFGIRY